MWRLLVIAVFALVALPARAHEDHEEEEATPDAGVPMPQRETVVRQARPARTAGETTIGRDVIDAAPRTGATDLLRLVPGLVASQHSGEGKAQQLFLRGFDAVHGQDVELNVAGLPVNEVSHVHALGYADLNWLIPDAVREVRVFEGSGRAWQGDFAVAGTVRYELGLEEPGLTAAITRGNFERTRFFAGYRPTFDEQTFAAVEYVEGAGFGPGRGFSRLSALGQLRLKFDPLTVRAVVGSYTSTYESPGAQRDDAVRLGAADFFDVRGPGQGGSSSRHQVLLGAELHRDDSRTALEAYGILLGAKLRNNFTGLLQNPDGDGLEQRQNTGTLGLKLTHARHLHLFGQIFTLELGAGVRHDASRQTQRGYDEATGLTRPVVFDGAATAFREGIDVTFAQTLASAWGELAWAPEGWRFMVGGRVDLLGIRLDDAFAFSGQGAQRSAFGLHLGAKASVEKSFGEHVKLVASYGDGFRTPQARQLSNGERAPFVDVRGAELGLRFGSERLSATALGFGSYVGNDFFFDHSVGTTSFVGPTLRGGGQLNVTAQPVEGFLVSLAFTAAHAQLLERRALLPYFAPLVGRLDSSYTRAFVVDGVAWRPFIGVGATFIGPRPMPDDTFSRAVFLLDAHAGLRLGPVELKVALQNVLDSRWRDGEFVYASQWSQGATVSLLPARHFTAGTPRTIAVTLEVRL